MSAVQWLAVFVCVAIVAFVAWTWFMNRWDEREERRHREKMLR